MDTDIKNMIKEINELLLESKYNYIYIDNIKIKCDRLEERKSILEYIDIYFNNERIVSFYPKEIHKIEIKDKNSKMHTYMNNEYIGGI